MIRITAPKGLIMISVPNLASPYYNEMKTRERNLFGGFEEYLYPMRDYFDVNPKKLLEDADLGIVKEGYVLLAPSVPIKNSTIGKDDYQFFKNLPKVNGATIDKIKAWELLEKSAPSDIKSKYGWFAYAIGRKT